MDVVDLMRQCNGKLTEPGRPATPIDTKVVIAAAAAISAMCFAWLAVWSAWNAATEVTATWVRVYWLGSSRRGWRSPGPPGWWQPEVAASRCARRVKTEFWEIDGRSSHNQAALG